MKAPDIIYLHQTIDAKSGIAVGMEWTRSKIAESDTAYFSEEAVKEAVIDMLNYANTDNYAEAITYLVKRLKGGKE